MQDWLESNLSPGDPLAASGTAISARRWERLEDRTLLAAPHPFDLNTLDGSNGFRLDGVDAGDSSGESVSTAGDVNADGYADILVGAQGADRVVTAVPVRPTWSLAAGVVLRPAWTSPRSTAGNGFRLDGIDAGDRSGRSVSNAGDVNGDGYADILVGARNAAPGGDNSAGETYVDLWQWERVCIQHGPLDAGRQQRLPPGRDRSR